MGKYCGECGQHEDAERTMGLLADALTTLMSAEGGEAGDSPEQIEAWEQAEAALKAAGREPDPANERVARGEA